MSEENLDLDLEREEINEEEVKLSPAEEKAMASGWRPEDEWTGEPDDWVDAKTFNRNGEFMSRIQQQSKQLNSYTSEIDNLKSAMKALGEHNKKIAEQEYKKALSALKKEKIDALEDDDHASVVEIDEKMDELKEAKKAAENSLPSEEEHPADNTELAPNPAFVEWAGENSWYHNDISLRGAADAIGMEYADRNQGAPIEDVLKYVTSEMKRKFPHNFGNERQVSAGTVTEKTGTGKRPKKSKYTEKDLSDEQRQFAKMFVDTGAFENVQEYVDQLVDSGEL